MLEIKNAHLEVDGHMLIDDFSLVASEGCVTTITSLEQIGATALFAAMQGLQPLTSGYITIDGELVSAGSGPFFRNMMTVIPADLSFPAMKVSDLVDQVASLQCNHETPVDKSAVLTVWQFMSLPASLYDEAFDSLDQSLRQLVLLSLAEVLHRQYVLVDRLQPSDSAVASLNRLAAHGAVVIMTTT